MTSSAASGAAGFAIVDLLGGCVAPAAGLRVVPVVGSDADGVLRTIAAADLGEPWIVVAPAAQQDLVAEVVTATLAGHVGVFGLAGVVLVGMADVPAFLRDRLVPAAAVVAGAATEAAVAELTTAIALRGPRVPAAWARMIASSRTDVAMRAALARRALADDPAYEPRAWTRRQLSLLREIAARVVPQGEGPRIDLAARADRLMHAGEGDGWRPAGMPTDLEASRAGLDALAEVWPGPDGERDALIRRIVSGDAPAGGRLTPAQLTSWFEDLRNDLTRLWLSHPASLARVGYSGFATGGTGAEPAGYLVLAAGAREPWEPEELGRLSSGGSAS